MTGGEQVSAANLANLAVQLKVGGPANLAVLLQPGADIHIKKSESR